METEEKLLKQYEDTLKLKPKIDPRVALPEDFPNIGKYVKSLGGEPIAIDFQDLDDTVLHVLFPGGTVDYTFSKQLELFVPELLISFAVTTHPGVRAIGTSKLDTHVVFELIQLSRYDKKLDLESVYLLSEDIGLKVDVLEPEEQNIKDWWQNNQ